MLVALSGQKKEYDDDEQHFHNQVPFIDDESTTLLDQIEARSQTRQQGRKERSRNLTINMNTKNNSPGKRRIEG